MQNDQFKQQLTQWLTTAKPEEVTDVTRTLLTNIANSTDKDNQQRFVKEIRNNQMIHRLFEPQTV